MARAGTAAAQTHSDAGESVLGRGTRVRGRVHGDGALRVEGAIEGGVQVSGDLDIDDGGSVVGEHTVSFFGDGEVVTLEHRALDRDIFARGALRSAAGCSDQVPGT